MPEVVLKAAQRHTGVAYKGESGKQVSVIGLGRVCKLKVVYDFLKSGVVMWFCFGGSVAIVLFHFIFSSRVNFCFLSD